MSITLLKSGGFAGVIIPTVTSCDSLVRVCIPDLHAQEPELQLQFDLNGWLHIAEVAFYGDGPQCPPDTVITADPTVTPSPGI